jgi:hypothetical protein
LDDPTRLRLLLVDSVEGIFGDFVLDQVRRHAKGGEHFSGVIREPCQEGRRRRQGHRQWQEGPVAHEQGDLAWSLA